MELGCTLHSVSPYRSLNCSTIGVMYRKRRIWALFDEICLRVMVSMYVFLQSKKPSESCQQSLTKLYRPSCVMWELFETSEILQEIYRLSSSNSLAESSDRH